MTSKNRVSPPRHLYMVGTLADDPQEVFTPNRPYTGCRICGQIFQSDIDRIDNPSIEQIVEGFERRRAWSVKHEKTHKPIEHKMLELSGMWCTPEAAQVFEGFGIVSLSDLEASEEHQDAMKSSKPIIVKEVHTK